MNTKRCCLLLSIFGMVCSLSSNSEAQNVDYYDFEFIGSSAAGWVDNVQPGAIPGAVLNTSAPGHFTHDGPGGPLTLAGGYELLHQTTTSTDFPDITGAIYSFRFDGKYSDPLATATSNPGFYQLYSYGGLNLFENVFGVIVAEQSGFGNDYIGLGMRVADNFVASDILWTGDLGGIVGNAINSPMDMAYDVNLELLGGGDIRVFGSFTHDTTTVAFDRLSTLSPAPAMLYPGNLVPTIGGTGDHINTRLTDIGTWEWQITVPVPVPEPSGALLLGVTGMWGILRRRRVFAARTPEAPSLPSRPLSSTPYSGGDPLLQVFSKP